MLKYKYYHVGSEPLLGGGQPGAGNGTNPGIKYMTRITRDSKIIYQTSMVIMTLVYTLIHSVFIKLKSIIYLTEE